MGRILARREVKEEPNEVFRKSLDGKVYAYPIKIEPFSTNIKIAQKDYALVQKGNYVRDAISMKQEFNDSNFDNANIEVLKAGLVVPKIEIFMQNYRNVNEALSGKGILYDASGEVIEGERLEKYANVLNHTCWVWLNANFRKGNGFRRLDLITIKGLDKEGKIITESTPLEKCLEENCYADLESLNSQGLPTERASVQKYEIGKTIWFKPPAKDMVARFNANSDGADLGCGRNPADSYSYLGVFSCAEGTDEKNQEKK